MRIFLKIHNKLDYSKCVFEYIMQMLYKITFVFVL